VLAAEEEAEAEMAEEMALLVFSELIEEAMAADPELTLPVPYLKETRTKH